MTSYDRMPDNQVADLAMAIAATAEVLGQTLTADAAEMMADDLADYPVEVVGKALKSCRRELRGRLTLAEILARVQAADGRPGKDEAWSIALASSDEFDTVVSTDEIQIAFGAARAVLERGDKVGARMAFISAYERLVSKAREEATKVNWHVSIGFDANRRVEAISKAVQYSRISQESGALYLADLSVAPITEDGRAIAGLITGTVARPSADVRERLKAVKSSMAEMKEASDERKLQIKIKAANDLADRLELLRKQGEELQAREIQKS